MNTKSIVLGLTALVIAGMITLPQNVNAYKGDPSVEGPNHTEERHEAMEKAFANKDYTAWKNLLQGKGKVTQLVNEKNFTHFVDAHNLLLQGKKDESNKIRTEFGLGLQNGSGKTQGGYGRNNR
jgi:hypothetical protein